MSTQPQSDPHPSDSPSDDDSEPEALSPPASKPGKRRRNGKIARLEKLERDMVCRMLRDGVPYERIVGALDEVGIAVTVRNVSNWKTRGGYREWCEDQDQILETRLRQDALTDHLREDPNELPEVGLQMAATCFSQLLLNPEMQNKLQADPQRYLPVISTLCRVSKEIVNLQKYRDECKRGGHPKRQRELEKREDSKAIEITRKVYSEYQEAKPEGS